MWRRKILRLYVDSASINVILYLLGCAKICFGRRMREPPRLEQSERFFYS